MDKRREALLDFVEQAIERGYPDSQIRQKLLDNGISWVEAASLLTVAKSDTGKPATNEEPNDEKVKSSLPPLLLTLAGLVMMVFIYFYRLLNGMFNYPVLGPLNTVWPLIFPIMTNVLNFMFFRKKFLFNLILSLIVIILLAMILAILPLIGI